MSGAPSILVLGGYGDEGGKLCRLLLAHTQSSLVVAGRRLSRASAACDELNREFVGLRARPRYGDASDAYTLTAALAGVDLVVAASTTSEYATRVAEAAMNAGADYMDCHFDQRIVGEMQALDARARETGHCIVTQAGVFPGLPGVLVRALAGTRGRLGRARVSIAVSYRVTHPEATVEVVKIAADPQPNIVDGGIWRKGGWRDAVSVDFGGGFGRRLCYPLEMVEMREAAMMLGVGQGGLYISGVNWFVDGIAFPLILAFGARGGPTVRRSLASLLAWGANNMTKAPIGISLVAEGDDSVIRIDHEDPYVLGAMSITSCVRQWIGGRLRRPGVLLAGLAADPAATLDDLARFGAKVRTSPLVPPASAPSP